MLIRSPGPAAETRYQRAASTPTSSRNSSAARRSPLRSPSSCARRHVSGGRAGRGAPRPGPVGAEHPSTDAHQLRVPWRSAPRNKIARSTTSSFADVDDVGRARVVWPPRSGEPMITRSCSSPYVERSRSRRRARRSAVARAAPESGARARCPTPSCRSGRGSAEADPDRLQHRRHRVTLGARQFLDVVAVVADLRWVDSGLAARRTPGSAPPGCPRRCSSTRARRPGRRARAAGDRVAVRAVGRRPTIGPVGSRRQLHLHASRRPAEPEP